MKNVTNITIIILLAIVSMGLTCLPNGDNGDNGPTPSPWTCDPTVCDDGNPCNGTEYCSNDVFDRCLAGEPPCPQGEICVELDGGGTRCETCAVVAANSNPPVPASELDYDGDGSFCPEDCNDADARRFPGNSEVCLANEGRYKWQNWTDEDCRWDIPYSFSDRALVDQDSDGRVSAYCVNSKWEGGSANLFTENDCNDNDSSMYPTNTEVCDGKDNDCDGAADDGLPKKDFYVDCDGDNLRAHNRGPVSACGPSALGTPTGCQPEQLSTAQWIEIETKDCDDTNPALGERICNPGGWDKEQCDQICNDLGGDYAAYSSGISIRKRTCNESCAWGSCEWVRDRYWVSPYSQPQRVNVTPPAGWAEYTGPEPYWYVHVPINWGPSEGVFFWTKTTLPPGSYYFTFEASAHDPSDIPDHRAPLRMVFVEERGAQTIPILTNDQTVTGKNQTVTSAVFVVTNCSVVRVSLSATDKIAALSAKEFEFVRVP